MKYSSNIVDNIHVIAIDKPSTSQTGGGCHMFYFPELFTCPLSWNGHY